MNKSESRVPSGAGYLCNCSRLAQLVERLTAEWEVVDSNPRTRPILGVLKLTEK